MKAIFLCPTNPLIFQIGRFVPDSSMPQMCRFAPGPSMADGDLAQKDLGSVRLFGNGDLAVGGHGIDRDQALRVAKLAHARKAGEPAGMGGVRWKGERAKERVFL